MRYYSFPGIENQNSTSRRAGFTLIELLIVVVILTILMGLLFPALSSMRRSARRAEVRKEIDDLETALEQFKAKFGSYPPSRITLYGDDTMGPNGWNQNTPEARRSKALIKRFWPKFNFSLSDPNNPNSADGAGGTFNKGEPYRLDGAECLVFFLGGVRDGDGAYVGFSNNPAQPFSVEPINSRVGPFFRFEMDRVVPDPDGDEFTVYLDTLPDQTQPYIYLSGYNGQGYDAFDLDTDSNSATTGDSRMTSPYIQSGSTQGWNPKKFQIISAGQDGQYGDGGIYNPDTVDADLIDADRNGDGDILDPGEHRKAERDNITNFSSGTLAN